MKNVKISMLALSVLAGGAVIASAAAVKPPPDVGTNYLLNAEFTNNPPKVAEVTGIPIPATTHVQAGGYGVVFTDGGGKVDGVQDVMADKLTDLAPYDSGFYIADITGSMSTAGKNNAVSVKVNLKGSGYAEDTKTNAVTQASSTFAMTFTGSGLAVSNSAVVPVTTNVTVIYLDSDGNTNHTQFYGYNPQTNVHSSPTVQYITFSADSSSANTNVVGGTNFVTINNAVYSDVNDVNFGTPLSTTVLFTDTHGTNQFHYYPLGTNISYTVTRSGTSGYTNVIPGLDIKDLPSFIAAYTAAQTIAYSDYAYKVTGVTTNISTGYTNMNVTGIPSFTNSWTQVSGTLSGAIKAGKKSHLFGSRTTPEGALLSQSHTIYTDKGLDTNPNSDTAFTEVVTSQDLGGGLDLVFGHGGGATGSGGPLQRVLTFGKNMWLSGQGFSGKGTLDPKKNTYKATATGVGSFRGSSLALNGSTGPLIAGFSTATNAIGITNIAALFPPVFIIVSPPQGGTNPVVTTTNISGTTVIKTTSDFGYVNPMKTNTVPNGIKSINLSGKVYGQKVGPTIGTNLDASF